MNQPLKLYIFHNREKLHCSSRIQIVAAEFDRQAVDIGEYRYYEEIPNAFHLGPKGVILSFEKEALD